MEIAKLLTRPGLSEEKAECDVMRKGRGWQPFPHRSSPLVRLGDGNEMRFGSGRVICSPVLVCRAVSA